MTGALEILEGGTGRPGWRTRWTGLPPNGRRLVAVVAVLVLLGGGIVWFRSWSAERDLRQAVELTTALGVLSPSTTPPGGEVRYFVRIRNDGVRPLSVTAVDAVGEGLRLRMQDEGDRPVDPGREIDVPVSARLSCGVPDASQAGLTAEIRVRREDGGSTVRRLDLEPAALLLDAARTLCAVRPALRDHELSGPVLRPS
jgi:hypothetical protein